MKKKKGFTLTEALLVMVLLGVIAAITIPQLVVDNPTKKGWDTMAEKMVGYLMQASTEILIYNSGLDDFTNLKYEDSVFSIEDSDSAPKIAGLYAKYISNVTGKIDLSKSYFTDEIVDFNRNSTGIKLKDNYTGFLYTNDGVIVGFRTYGGCTNSEQNINLPTFRAVQTVLNVCGSVFFDINGYKEPNKLGSDQYIIPIGKRGIKFEDN